MFQTDGNRIVIVGTVVQQRKFQMRFYLSEPENLEDLAAAKLTERIIACMHE